MRVVVCAGLGPLRRSVIDFPRLGFTLSAEGRLDRTERLKLMTKLHLKQFCNTLICIILYNILIFCLTKLSILNKHCLGHTAICAYKLLFTIFKLIDYGFTSEYFSYYNSFVYGRCMPDKILIKCTW